MKKNDEVNYAEGVHRLVAVFSEEPQRPGKDD